MSSTSFGPTVYLAFCLSTVFVLKLVNEEVTQPYMDEPFHVPQAQAYCEHKYTYWDPKITTPPGLYILSLILRRVFMLKCNLAMLRLTPMLALLSLPIAITRLVCYHKRERAPASLLVPSPEAVVISAFPIAWFFGFLYYTEVPSLGLVVLTVVAATQDKHWIAAFLGAVSCTFRQTNVIWVLYAFATSQVMQLRFRRPNDSRDKLYDAPAMTASPADLLWSIASVPKVLPQILPSFLPYAVVLAAFGAFVVWNGGIVLGDKSNHIASLHVPQLYYFVGFATLMGWPALLGDKDGILSLARGVYRKMFGSRRNAVLTCVVSALMAGSIHKFTIHHPFLLADNRHYTFYVWRRVFMLHPLIPYLLIPGYIACAWLWYLRIGRDQTLLQNLLLPLFVTPMLLPTPLLEPRYFLVPYILLRAQVIDVPGWGVVLEGLWYAAINAATMWIFLYKERDGVGRFMW
ncbi:glucosyltransferase [Cytidiella melzeri]|nr:glucosyltransferase [Cytidiella melzeri]